MSTHDIAPHDQIEAWTKARLGKVTASRVADVIAKTKSGWSTARRGYLIELIAERLTGMRADAFLNQAMIWGAETEYSARVAYEQATNRKVKSWNGKKAVLTKCEMIGCGIPFWTARRGA